MCNQILSWDFCEIFHITKVIHYISRLIKKTLPSTSKKCKSMLKNSLTISTQNDCFILELQIYLLPCLHCFEMHVHLYQIKPVFMAFIAPSYGKNKNKMDMFASLMVSICRLKW